VQRLFKGGKPIFSDPSPTRRDSLMEGKSAVQEMLAGVRENISDGREKAFALLTGQQAAKAQDIEAKAEKALEDEEQQARGRGKP
jgi:putative intracellular protease/amidase